MSCSEENTLEIDPYENLCIFLNHSKRQKHGPGCDWLIFFTFSIHKGDVIDQRGGTDLVLIPDFHVGFERLGIL